jgi:hypothetical protein
VERRAGGRLLVLTGDVAAERGQDPAVTVSVYVPSGLPMASVVWPISVADESADRGGGQAGRVDLDQGEVVVGRLLDEPGVVGRAVLELDAQRLGALDDVAVGEDVAVGRDDDPGSRCRLRLAERREASVDTPLAVIVTTDFWASAMTSGEVERLDGRRSSSSLAPSVEDDPGAPGTSWVIAATVPPAASVALRTAAASTVPMPRLRPLSARVAAGVEPATGADGAPTAGPWRRPRPTRSGWVGGAGEPRSASSRGGRRCGRVAAAGRAGRGRWCRLGGLTKIGRSASSAVRTVVEGHLGSGSGMHSRVDYGQ